MHLQLDGLMIADALAIVERQLADKFAIEAKKLAADLKNDGVNGDEAAAMLDDHRAKFETWRKENLAEHIDWLITCDELMPSTALH